MNRKNGEQKDVGSFLNYVARSSKVSNSVLNTYTHHQEAEEAET